MRVYPDFRRFRQALLCQGEPDRVPLFDSIHSDIKSGFLGRPVRTLADEIDFCAQAGYDYFRITTGMRLMLRRDAALPGQEVPPGPTAPLLKPHRERYNPFDDQERVRYWAEEGQGAVTSLAEFEAFPWPSPEDFSLTPFKEAASLLPPGMKLIASIGWVYSATWMLMGFETFCLALVEQPELIQRMFERMGEIQLGVCRRVAALPQIGTLLMSDDIAYTEGLLISPTLLRRYVFPWYDEMNSVAREHDLPVIFHSDGRLWEVLEDILACGFCGLHPVEPKAMDIVELKARVMGRLCVMGNIDLAYTLTLGSPQEVAEEVKMRLRQLAPGGGYILGSSNSVPEYVPLANYQAMRETALRYGVYPIQV